MRKFIITICTIFIATVAHADTLNVTWYNADGTTYDTTMCTVGGTLNMPTAPTKRGYTFQGWRTNKYDVSTLDPSINGTDYSVSNGVNYIKFSYGTLHIIPICSATRGVTQWERGNADTNTNGVYCWWKLTEFTPSDDIYVYQAYPSYSTFFYTYNNFDQCKVYCSSWANSYIKDNETTRASLFGL